MILHKLGHRCGRAPASVAGLPKVANKLTDGASHWRLESLTVLSLVWVLIVQPAALADETDEAGVNGVDGESAATHSVARQWNELLLFAIRRDFARPTVHARNLFHTSAAMYDAWATYDDVAIPLFLGRTQRNGTGCAFTDTQRAAVRDAVPDSTRQQLRETAISHAMYRLLRQRFAESPGRIDVFQRTDELFVALGYDAANESTNLDEEPGPAELGNAIADCIIKHGQSDGSNEAADYANRRYESVNAPLDPTMSGNPGLANPNRWQPLQLDIFIDQSGNSTGIPLFLGAEWSAVEPFALTADDITMVERDGEQLPVYLDPGPPALLGDDPGRNTAYLHGHALVALWSRHLDPEDGVVWDISPAALGNANELPNSPDGILEYYDRLAGGDRSAGHARNPATGQPYAENRVPRGDYTRVLAEFWADGPDSETPPGHWFRLYNETVSDHEEFERRFMGTGALLDTLEMDIKAYFLLGAAMHDSAIAAWSAKGGYDYVRPVSALRYMAEQGQSSDAGAARYSVQGVPLEVDRIEVVQSGDPLAGNGGVNVGKIKVLAWRGPDFIGNPDTDVAGVGWILMEDWWPYQRPTFVTPPFAGYVSGHSTFSRAAAEILTRLTGDPFFPGGLATFTANRNDFLVFEEGPSVDVELQWATYRDASDQTSLSRIWGGIHPPVDDIPGRQMGIEVSERVWARAATFFDGTAPVSDLDGVATGGDAGSGASGGDNGRSASGGGGCSVAMGTRRYDPLLAVLFGLALLLTGFRAGAFTSFRVR